MSERLVTLQGVLVLRQTDFGWHCEQNGRPLFLAKGQVAPGLPIDVTGARGSVQVREFAIRDLFPAGMPWGM